LPTVAAQAPQNREYPHGTNATPSRGAIEMGGRRAIADGGEKSGTSSFTFRNTVRVLRVIKA